MRPARFVLTAVALSLLLVTGPVPAVGGSQNVIVSPHPIEESPHVLDGRIYALAQLGDRIVVGGTFTTVRDWNSDVVLTRNRIFAFDRNTGLVDPGFAPDFNEDVNAIEAAADGQSIYVGGSFTTLNGLPRSGLVKISVPGGVVDPTFKATANKMVNDMELVGDRLIVGGRFTKISKVALPLLAALDPTTGAVLPWMNLPGTGSRNQNEPFIQELDVSPDGRRLAIVGNFLQVGGVARDQIALIDLTTNPASLADWATLRYQPDCAEAYDDTYMRDVNFSPDSSFFIAVTTGAFYANTLCDTAHRWETNLTGSNLSPTWVTYTGGDTHWHTLVTEAAVYVGGHQRWENNPNPSPGGDDDGPGSVSRQGIAALDPLTGVPLSWNPSRHRGQGVEAFLATDDHLYVGSDTTRFDGRRQWRLAVLPTATGMPNPGPDVLALPVDVYTARTDGSLYRSTFDGQSFTATSAQSGPGIDGFNWSSLRDGFLQAGQLTYFGANSAYYRRPFDGTSFGTETNLSTSVGYTDVDYSLTPYDQPYNVDTTRAVAYSKGRLYYTRTNDTRLFWRWYSLESGIIGAQEYLASSASWSGVTGLEIAGNWLYASQSDNKLYRAYVNGPLVDATSKTLVDDGNASGRPWAQTRALVFQQAEGAGYEPPPPPPPPQVTCSGTWKAEYFSGTQLGAPAATVRCETTVAYDWGSGSPSGTGVGPDQFSVRWTKTINPSQSGTYNFTVRADDGIRLSVDGTVVINQWRDQSATTYTASRFLAAGSHTIVAEYYESGGSAVASVGYSVQF
jgi:hypothetical protein